MAYSMTGFGRGEASSVNRKIVVEMRSVNHRYCDITVKMPRAFSNLEERLRQLITAKINRGKIDVYVNFVEQGEHECAVTADTGLAGAYIEAAGMIKSRYNLRDDVNLSSLMRLPGIFQIEDKQPDEEEIWEIMGKAAGESLEALISMRDREGRKLIDDIAVKLKTLGTLLSQVEARAPFIAEDYRNRLNARITELLGQNVPDENRVAMEVAIFADRCSVDEEITRFKSHIVQAEACCASGEPIGRKLDFILQEINREINTIGSKANDLSISENIVEMKSEAEKIREQIQNLE